MIATVVGLTIPVQPRPKNRPGLRAVNRPREYITDSMSGTSDQWVYSIRAVRGRKLHHLSPPSLGTRVFLGARRLQLGFSEVRSARLPSFPLKLSSPPPGFTDQRRFFWSFSDLVLSYRCWFRFASSSSPPIFEILWLFFPLLLDFNWIDNLHQHCSFVMILFCMTGFLGFVPSLISSRIELIGLFGCLRRKNKLLRIDCVSRTWWYLSIVPKKANFQLDCLIQL